LFHIEVMAQFGPGEPDVNKLANPAWPEVTESFWGLLLARGQAFLKEGAVLPFWWPICEH
jgi:hypothetical protein